MNNHCVPDFEMDEYPAPTPSSLLRSRKPHSIQDDEVMELLWQNGQVVMQGQNQHRPNRASSINVAKESTEAAANQLFIQEDEMASWLQYPLEVDDADFSSDLLLYPPSTTSAITTTTAAAAPPPPLISPRPPIPPASRVQGVGHFSNTRPPPRRRETELGTNHVIREPAMTMVESNETPIAIAMESQVAVGVGGGRSAFVAGGSFGIGGKATQTTSYDVTAASSSGASGASGAEPSAKPSAGKRKGRDEAAEETECRSQDVELKAADVKKLMRGSTAKRTRAAEVHNLSERRRRDRINEKMKALQELIPRCNKADKASMLDDAIEYLKSLQMQVQMMSMGCGMVPMMFPGMQQYMQPMGMGMGVDINRHLVPFPLPTPSHLGARFPLPAYHPVPPFVAPDSSRILPNNSVTMLNSPGTQNACQPQVQNLSDPYQQQYAGFQAMQMPAPQMETSMVQPNVSKPSTSGVPDNPEHHLTG